jgi:hypothetical protein
MQQSKEGHSDQGNYVCEAEHRHFAIDAWVLQLLVLELALQLLRLCNFADSLVKIVLVDCVAVVFDGEEATA